MLKHVSQGDGMERLHSVGLVFLLVDFPVGSLMQGSEIVNPQSILKVQIVVEPTPLRF
jgi:hypothetical protein